MNYYNNDKNFSEFKKGNIRKDQNANEITHFFSKYFVNAFGFMFYKIGLTPNQVTVIFMVTGIIGGLASFSEQIYLAYLLWRIHIIIDMADGAVARVTGLFSSYGDILDKVAHHIIYPIYWVGFLYAMNAIYDEPLLSLLFFAVSTSQWTSKHLLKSKDDRPQAKSLFKRLIANAMGIEGFLLFSLLNFYFVLVPIDYFLIYFIFSNAVFLFLKVANLLSKNDA